MRQLSFALEEISGINSGLPQWDVEPMVAGGWSIDTLPFVEPNLADHVFPGQTFKNIKVERALALTCPIAESFDRSDLDVPRSHYWLMVTKNRKSWAIIDTDVADDDPWFVGIDKVPSPMRRGPHFGGFNQLWRNGQLNYLERDWLLNR